MNDDPLAERIHNAIRDVRSDSAIIALRAKQELAEIGLPALGAIIAASDDEPYSTDLDELLFHLGPAAAPAIPGLVRRFRSRRTLAETALVAIGTDALPPVIASLRTASDLELGVERHHEILTRFPEVLTLDLLIAALAEPDGNFRVRLIPAIGQFRTAAEKAIPALIELLQGTDGSVRTAAGTALAKIGGQNAVSEIAKLTDSDREEIVVSALLTLGECRRNRGDGDDTFRRSRCDFLGLLQGKLNDLSPQIRIAAAIELQRATLALTEQTIEAALAACESSGELSESISRLEGVHREQGLNETTLWRVLGLVKDRQVPFHIRRAAAVIVLDSQAALRLRDPHGTFEAIKCIYKGLKDPEDPRQVSYLRAAGRAGSRAAPLVSTILLHLQSAILPHLEWEYSARCQAAIRALGEIGVADDAVLDRLEKHLSSRDRSTEHELVIALGRLGASSPRAVEMLASKLEGSGALTYAVILELALLGVKADAAVPALAREARQKCFLDCEGDDDGIFCRTLGKIATPQAIHELRRLYRNNLLNHAELREAVSALTRLDALPDDDDSGAIPSGTIPVDFAPSDPDTTAETVPHAEGETAHGLP